MIASSYLKPFKPFLLGLACFIIYNANLRIIGSADSYPARFLPLTVLKEGTLSLESNSRLFANGHSLTHFKNRPAGATERVTYFEPWAYWMIRTRDNKLVSLYPVVTPLLVTPLYVPAILWLNHHGWEQQDVGWIAELMEKISASILASIAVVLMYILLRREDNRWCLLLAIAFAFGTNTWMISSQALWQHGTGELLIALGLLLVTIPSSPLRLALLGAVCVLITANRPPDGLVAAAFFVTTIWNHPKRTLWFLSGAAIPLVPILWYNLVFIGHLAGAYPLRALPAQFFKTGWQFWSGITGLLVSPTKGLLTFCPFLLFLPFGLIPRFRNAKTRILSVALCFAIIGQIVLYAHADWRAGVSWGPRWLTDLLPILVWLLAPAPYSLSRLTRILFHLLIAGSILIQTIGAFWYTGSSDKLILSGNPISKSGAWDWNNIPFITELRHAAASSELLYRVDGSIDRLGTTDISTLEETPQLNHDDAIEGWALVGTKSPAELFLIIDGVVVGRTDEFFRRTDVEIAKHTSSLSGWRVIATTLGIAPGKRVIQLAARTDKNSNIRIIQEQQVVVRAPSSTLDATSRTRHDSELADLATRAAKLLQNNQTENGYWQTPHTRKMIYHEPTQEMNVFLTSMLADLLLPIADEFKLNETLDRAIQHLTSQIEVNGLVRYHGLPTGPTIGKTGCVITPDSDDTALVWRIANLTNPIETKTDPRLKQMLAELGRYRDSRGFYYTWLAPREHYQCIDPGPDSNPTDLTIQMNVYLMLKELDPKAADELCSALKRSFYDENVWVYYAKSPIIAHIRSAEIQRIGCDIPSPIERLMLPAQDQKVWSTAAYLLAQEITSPGNKQRTKEIHSLLAQLGEKDFLQIQRNPPLLYHNDLTATVPRYYWSEDFGYALWLRLYQSTLDRSDNIAQWLE